MNAARSISYGLGVAWDGLQEMMADVTPEAAHRIPPGAAVPVAALYLHTVYLVDAVIHRLLQDRPPLWDTGGWAGKVGTQVDPDLGSDWARTARIDLAAAREYAHLVYASTCAYVAGLEEDDLDRVIPSNLSRSTTLGQLLHSLVIWQLGARCGEISALKAVQGLGTSLF